MLPSGKGGFIGTLLMGLTFRPGFVRLCRALHGHSAGGVGSGGSNLRPVLGMVAFASGLALPFFLLALFPHICRSCHASGELAGAREGGDGLRCAAPVMLKYLYSLDAVLQTGFLTRERFLAAWVVLFAMAGFYLLGFVRLPGISPGCGTGCRRGS